MTSLELVVGDPGSGKTGYLYYRLWQYIREGWRAIVISTVEDREESKRRPPLRCEDADTLAEALEKAGDDRHVVIGYDEVGLEIDDNSKPSTQLRMLGRYRRHLKVRFVMTTQRPHDLPAKVRDLDVSHVVMRLSDTASFASKWLRREYGDELADQAAELEPYWWQDGQSAPPQAGKHYVRAR